MCLRFGESGKAILFTLRWRWALTYGCFSPLPRIRSLRLRSWRVVEDAMLGADFRFTPRPASAGARHYLVCALTLILLLFGVSAGRAKAQASAANSGTRPSVIELRIGDEVEPIMAEYIDGGIEQAAARARQSGPHHHGHAGRSRDVHGRHDPAHSGFAGARGRLSFRRPARGAPRRDFSSCCPRMWPLWLPARTPARLRRCWRLAAFR